MRWKWIIGIGVFLIIVLVAAVYVFLHTYDYNKLKPRIARMVKEATGRDLNLGGEIILDIGFSPALVVTDITLTNASWGLQPQMVKIDELQAQVRLLPLLARDVELRYIGLRGVEVLLETNKDGQGNWKFPDVQSPVKSAGASKATKINVDRVRLENLNLTFRDGETGSATQVSLADFKLAKQTAGDVVGVDLKADYDGQPITLSGKIGLISELLAHKRFPLKLSGTFSDAAVELEGAVDDVLDLRGIDLQARVSGNNLASLGLEKTIKLPQTSAYDVAGHLRGSRESLTLNDLSGNLSGSDAHLAFSGKVGNLIAINGIDLQLKASGKDLTEIGALIDQKLPATDEFAVEGRLTGSAKALSLKETQGSATQGNLSVALSGEVKDLISFSGLDLQVKGSGKNLAEIGSIIGEKLPATEEFKVQGRLTGSAKALSLKDIQGSARHGGLSLGLTGVIEDLVAPGGVDLILKGAGRDLAEVGPIIGEQLPKTGAFTLEGRLTGSAKSFSLQEVVGNIRRGGLRLNMQGGIKNLLALSGMNLKIDGSGKDLSEVGPIIGKKLPTTDNFSVQGRLMGSTKALSLQEAMGRASRAGMSVAFDGGITDLLALRSINIRLKASGKELAAIGPLVGSDLPKIGPFDARGHLIGSAKLLLLKEFSAIVDKSDFKGLAKIEFRNRPKITVRLESSVLDITPFMRMAERDKQELGKEDKRERRLFPEDPLPFDALKRVDTDFDFKARGIRMRGAQLEFGHLTLILADSNLSIEKLEATYKETKISGNLHIDPGSPPQVATHFLVQGFNLGEFLKETGKNDQVRGIVDIAAHGKSSGDSVSSLMAHLNGAFGAVMGPGYLTKYLDLLSMDLSTKVIPLWGRNKKADEINCAVVQFDIKNGVANSKAFVFDSQIGILSAEGDSNLGTERVNFLLNPRPKDFSLLNLSTKVRVTGTIMKPKVRPDTLSLVKRGAEEVLGALVLGPIGLLAPFVHLGAHKKHPCEVKSLGKLGIQTPISK